MTLDASSVARATAIDTQFKDLRSGNVLFLPQRIAVFAQGATANTYPSTKFQALSHAQVGALMGYGTPAHLCVRELLPDNADGVGTIPVTVYPLSDDGSGVAAQGDITPSGTQTKAAEYHVRIAGILSATFVIPAGVIDVTDVCALIGRAIQSILHMPVTVQYAYGTVTGAAGGSNTGDGTISSLSVITDNYPYPGDYTLTCTAASTDAGTFSLTDPFGTVVSTTVAVSGSAVQHAGLEFTLTDGAADFIVGDTFTITVPATKVNLVAKWKGASGNAIYAEVLGDSLGTTFAITQPTGGLANPTLDAALAQVGDNVWETFGLNALNHDDTTALDTIQTWGDGRWTSLVRKPLVMVRGNTDASETDATAVTSVRRDDKVNAQLSVPGSVNLPCVAAARELARIAKRAQNNPPHDYGSLKVDGIIPGTDAQQWDHTTRDAAVKAGSSTSVSRDGVVHISDVVTHYRPEGEEPPAFRYVVDIVKLQQILYNLDLIFSTDEWDGAPLIPDSQPTKNPAAKQPKMAKAAINAMIDSLADQAIISDAAAAKKATVVAINSQNPKRLDGSLTVQLSGNTNQKAITLNFGFYFGGATAA